MNLESIASEAFQILRSYDYTCLLYDEDGNQVYEPNEARRFYAKSKNMLLSIIDKGEDSTVRLFVAKSLPIASIEGMINALRTMATKYSVVFNVREWARDEMEPKDFATKSSVSESKASMNILEGMYGTSRSSYLRLENARLIVRHSAKINENILGARGRNIDSIYVEDGVGQRMLFPTTQLAPARAMAHHVDNGGSWADPVGEQICRMAQDFADLIQAARHIQSCSSELTESAMSLRECVRGKVVEMRRTFESLCRKTRYAEAAEKLRDTADALNECEAPSYADRVGELASIVNTPDHKLAENVLETVAKYIGEAEGEVDDYLKTLPPKKVDGRMKGEFAGDPTHMITVLGRKVDAYAWGDFKKGKLALVQAPKKANPKDELRPTQFRDPMAKLSFDLSSLAARCQDHSMMNLLSYVAEELPLSQGEMRAKLKGLAAYALRIGGGAPTDGVARTESVREFIEWMHAFTPAKVLLEERPRSYADPSMNGEHDDWVEEEIARFMFNFDAHKFIVDVIGEDMDPSEFEGEEREYVQDMLANTPHAEMIKKLANWMSSEFYDEHEIEPDMTGAAQKVWPQVRDALTKMGYHINESVAESDEVVDECGDGALEEACQCVGECECGKGQMAECGMDEDMELSREDVLLPTNQAKDLGQETEKATVTDPDTGKPVLADDSYINRLQALAGMTTKF